MDADGYRISLDPAELQLAVIHGYLTQSYWSPGVPLDVVREAVRNSVCAGAYAQGGAQVGFARLVTDRATFAYLADVFVLEPHRGKGISRAMVGALLALPETKGLRRILLATRDAHGLYAQLGFSPLSDPARFMEIARPDVYRRR